MLKLRVLFIIMIFTAVSSELSAQSSINWSFKSLVSNIGKLNLKKHTINKRELFFQNKLQQPSLDEPQTFQLKSSATRQGISSESDDLVLYDYSENSIKEKTQTKPSKSLSVSSVNQAPLEKSSTKEYIYDYTATDEEVCKANETQKISHVGIVEITTESILVNKKIEEIQNFEVSFFDDRDELITSDFEGVAILGDESILARSQSMRQIKLYATGHYQLTTKVDLREDRIEYRLPIIEKESMDDFLEKNNIPNYQGLLLVSVDEQVQNIFIDKPYKKRFYLSSDFKEVSAQNSSYLLYTGVDLGNLELTIENDNETLHKSIVHLRTQEVYYYAYEKSDNDLLEVQVCQQELIGSAKRRVSISGKQIELFSNEAQAEKVSINKYKLPRYGNEQYEKDYLIFKHLSEDIMLSTNQANYVELPSQGFLNFLVKEFNLNEVHCIVQLNFTKPIKSLNIEGYTALGFLPMNISYLDKSGLFDSVVNEKTNKAYITAQGEGSIYTKINYANGTVDYVESFCGPGSYSIEQL